MNEDDDKRLGWTFNLLMFFVCIALAALHAISMCWVWYKVSLSYGLIFYMLISLLVLLCLLVCAGLFNHYDTLERQAHEMLIQAREEAQRDADSIKR